MWEDPIVAEVHRAREKLAADCNYDIRAFFAGVRKRQVLQRKRTEPAAAPVAAPDNGGVTSSANSTPKPPRRPVS
jgi:hypothetical protein